MRFSIALPEDKRAILDCLLDRLEARFAGAIAIVACFGSHVTGAFTPVSDLDFYFVPKTNGGALMSYQFILDGIGYDLWPVSWERLERIASFDEPLVSIVAEARVVYCGEERDLEKFGALREKIKGFLSPEKKPMVVDRARRIVCETKALFFDAQLEKGDLEGVRLACFEMLELLLCALAHTNGTYVRRGAADVDAELRRFSEVPQGFGDRFHAVIEGHDPRSMLRDVGALIHRMDTLLSDAAEDGEPVITNRTIGGLYEELKSTYNKLYHACEKRDGVGAFFAACTIVNELRDQLGSHFRRYAFPDLITPLHTNDYRLVRERAVRHEEQLVDVLRSHGVRMNVFGDIREFRRAVMTRDSTTNIDREGGG